jgi:23S rRNA (pseudouridine1915-N3)-methyltransferase
VKISLHSVGTNEPEYITKWCDIYVKRISSFYNFNQYNHASNKQLYNSLHKEKSIKIGLDSLGKSLSSQEFSKKLINFGPAVSFYIGDSDGLLDNEKESFNELWSLSMLTFPHMFVRPIILEQIFRAHCIANNHPYAK